MDAPTDPSFDEARKRAERYIAEAKTPSERTKRKAEMFGIIYGQVGLPRKGPFSLRRTVS